MAKRCNICNQTYPQHLASCPHCADKAQAGTKPVPRVPPGSESEFDLGDSGFGGAATSQRPGSGSAIDLGKRGQPAQQGPPPGSESDIDIAPPHRVPDTSSGVIVHKAESASDSSIIKWAALVEDATKAEDASGLRVDSPSDEDLIAKAAAEGVSTADVDLASPAAPSSGDVSRVQVYPGSEADVVVRGDSASEVNLQPPAAPSETSGVSVVGPSEPDVVVAGAAGESSTVNLGGMNQKQRPFEQNQASDAVDSGPSGVDLSKAAAARGDSSVDAVVELAEDADAPSAPPSEASDSGAEQSGLDLARLSGASDSSAVLPGGPKQPQRLDEKTSPKAPRTQHAIGLGEHFSAEDTSAVDLGGGAGRPAAPDEDEPGSSGRIYPPESATDFRDDPDAPPQVRVDKESGPSDKPDKATPRSMPKVLAGAALGLILGVGATAGYFSMRDSGAKSSQSTGPGAAQPAAADQANRNIPAAIGGRTTEEIVAALDRLEQEKKEAEQEKKQAEKKAADLAEQLKAAETKATGGSGDVAKTAERKAAALAEELKAEKKRTTEEADKAKTAEKKATDFAAAAEAARKAEEDARKKAEEALRAAKQAQEKATAADTARRKIAAESDKTKDMLKSMDAKQAELVKQAEEAAAARKKAEASLQATVQKLKNAKYLPADASAADVARAVEQAIAAAKASDPSGKLAAAQADLASAQNKLTRAEEALAQRWTPQAMLDVWLALLQQPAAEPEMAKLALMDVERIGRDAKASAAVRAKAACVRGLALQQQGRKDEARTVLAEAIKNAPADAEWPAVARAALEEKPKPVVAQPVSSEPANAHPLQAESAYAAGVRDFWAGDYARAEQQFQNAIRNDSRDARYHYYLGLSRLSQNKRAEARRDFERASELEKQSRPARPAINAALERIQGSLRREVDQYRN
jgi:hypothetical protein